MEFAKEIKQRKPFKDNGVKAMLNVIYTAEKLQLRMVSLLKPFGINDQHYNILRILKGQGGKSVSPGQVKAVLINSRGDLTRLIDKLVKMELVLRNNSTVDRRVVELKIADKGLALLQHISAEFDKNKVYDFPLSNTEAEQLNILLDKLRG